MTAVEPCAAEGCHWTTGGTISGAGEPRCSMRGGLHGCIADWIDSADPEDREPYTDWLNRVKAS